MKYIKNIHNIIVLLKLLLSTFKEKMLYNLHLCRKHSQTKNAKSLDLGSFQIYDSAFFDDMCIFVKNICTYQPYFAKDSKDFRSLYSIISSSH